MQREGWSRVLGACASQVKSWFQQQRDENEKTLLSHENEKLLSENVVMQNDQDLDRPARQKRYSDQYMPRQIQ
jgi:hypothetical protein